MTQRTTPIDTSAETTIMVGSEAISNCDRKSASRAALPPTCWAIMAPATRVAARTVRFVLEGGGASLLIKGFQQSLQSSSADRQDPVDRRLELDFPVAPRLAVANLADVLRIDRVVAVNADEPAALERRHHLAEGADIPQRLGAAAPNRGLVAHRFEKVDVGRLHGLAEEAPQMQQNEIGSDHGQLPIIDVD